MLDTKVIEEYIENRDTQSLKQVVNNIDIIEFDEFRCFFLQILKKYDVDELSFFDKVLDYFFDISVFNNTYSSVFFSKRNDDLNEFIIHFDNNVMNYFKNKNYMYSNENLFISIFDNLLNTNKSNLKIDLLDFVDIMIDKSTYNDAFFMIYDSLYCKKRNERKVLKYLYSKGYTFDSEFFNTFVKKPYISGAIPKIKYINDNLSEYVSDVSEMDDKLIEYMIQNNYTNLYPTNLKEIFVF